MKDPALSSASDPHQQQQRSEASRLCKEQARTLQGMDGSLHLLPPLLLPPPSPYAEVTAMLMCQDTYAGLGVV